MLEVNHPFSVNCFVCEQVWEDLCILAKALQEELWTPVFEGSLWSVSCSDRRLFRAGSYVEHSLQEAVCWSLG